MIAKIALFATAIVYRLLPILLGLKENQAESLRNFSPMAALCVCGAAYLPRRFAIALPFAAVVVTELMLNAHYGFPLLTTEFLAKTVAFAAVTALGWRLRKNARPAVVLPAVIYGWLFFC